MKIISLCELFSLSGLGILSCPRIYEDFKDNETKNTGWLGIKHQVTYLLTIQSNEFHMEI